MGGPHQEYIHGLTTAVQQAIGRGRVILVGRGTRQLAGDTPDAFHVRLVAPRDWRVERMARLEGWTQEQALARCLEVDRTRERFTRYFFGPSALQSDQYDLIVNTGHVGLDAVMDIVLAVAQNEWTALAADRPSGQRVPTLARELGAGDTGFAPTLAARLGLRVYDRDLLEQEAVRLGVPEADLEAIDEQPAGIFQRFRPGSLYQRYFEDCAMVRRSLLVLAFLFVVAMLPAAEPTNEELARRAKVIKPAAAELKWQQIPWVTDLTQGLKLARAEKRPIFLWVTGDDPLERC